MDYVYILYVLFGIYVFEFCTFGFKFAFTFCDFTVCNVFIVNWKYRAQFIVNILCALCYCVLRTCDCVFIVYS